MLHFLSITGHTVAFRARAEENIAEKYDSDKKNIISKQSANNIKIIQAYKSQQINLKQQKSKKSLISDLAEAVFIWFEKPYQRKNSYRYNKP